MVMVVVVVMVVNDDMIHVMVVHVVEENSHGRGGRVSGDWTKSFKIK